MNLTYSQLFSKCLNSPYNHTYQGGSWYVEREGSTLFILLQWSNGAVDWFNNFDFPAKPYKDMPDTWKAHRGFVRVWKSIEPYVEPHVKDESVQEIIIIGYSHGASLAVLAHEYCWFNRPDIRNRIHGYGFEGARVFCGKCPDEIKDRWDNFLMFRNGTDIVTHLPPKIFGYKDVGTMVQINPEHDYPLRKRKLDCVNAHYDANVMYALKIYESEIDIEE